ncbi:hypothetical protein EMIT0P291_230081 [Pseudomonas sp. IT-P291]
MAFLPTSNQSLARKPTCSKPNTSRRLHKVNIFLSLNLVRGQPRKAELVLKCLDLELETINFDPAVPPCVNAEN